MLNKDAKTAETLAMCLILVRSIRPFLAAETASFLLFLCFLFHLQAEHSLELHLPYIAYMMR